MAAVIDQLRLLGFAEYEARVYVALLQRSPINGYEVAKLSGVPRADVYSVLRRLEERGAVVRRAVAAGIRYAPVAPEDILRRLRAQFQETVDAAERALRQIATPPEHQYVWNARGYQVLMEHAHGLVGRAKERLLVAVSTREAPAMEQSLAQAEARRVEITTLCLEACPRECGHCRGRIDRHRVPPEESSRWLILVADNAEMLAGQIGEAGDALAIRSAHPLLVGLATWYLQHSIALATLVAALGERAEKLLDPEALATLASLGPAGHQGWLEHMRDLSTRHIQPEALCER